MNLLSMEGVESSRVDLLPLAAANSDHLATYSIMDISLDPYPYAGKCGQVWGGVGRGGQGDERSTCGHAMLCFVQHCSATAAQLFLRRGARLVKMPLSLPYQVDVAGAWCLLPDQ